MNLGAQATREAAASGAAPRPLPVDRRELVRVLRAHGLGAGLAIALVLAAGLLVDHFHFANGISVDWRITRDDTTLVVARTVEHRIWFPNEHRALARYVANWRVAEHGVPNVRPPIDARVRARIRIPRGAARGIEIQTADTVTAMVDGAPIDSTTRIPAGWHLLELDWTGRLSASSGFRLQWENGDPIPREVLHPMEGPWPPSRAHFWWFIALAALFSGALFLWARAPIGESVRLSRALSVATLLVVAWGTGLRGYQYDLEPEPIDNYDEYFNLWNGFSLLEDGTSRGWSAWPSVYVGSDAQLEAFPFWGTDITIVSPYFENPPLMHLLVGAVTHLAGTDEYLDARVADGRLVSLALSALTIWLLILVGRKLAPSGPGPWLGGLLYASIPSIVLQTRVIKEEILVIPLALGTLFFFLRWRDEGRRERDLLLAATCAGLGVLTKIPAAMLVPGLIMLLVASGELVAARRALTVSVLLGAGALILFALLQGPSVLLLASSAQVGGRGLHFNLFPRFFDVLQVNGWFIGRGWLIFLWVASLATLYTWAPSRRAVIAVPLALYLTAIGVGTGNNTLGWYVLPIVAYLAIPAGIFLGELYRRPDLLRGTVFGLLLVMYTLNFVAPPRYFTLATNSHVVRPAVMLTVIALTAPYCLVEVWPRFRGLARATFLLGLATFLIVSAVVVVQWEVVGVAFRDLDHTTFYP